MALVSLRKNPRIEAITAITNKICIKPPAAYANVPIAHPMIRSTAKI